MKILITSTPATGHLNPLLAITRILLAEGHEITFLTGSAFRDRIENSGAKFVSLQGSADFDGRDLLSVAPELKDIPPGLEWFRIAIGHLLDRLPAQQQSLLQAVQECQADVIVGDDLFFGVLPMLLGSRSKRPPIVLCGTSFLHLAREDGAPNFLGLPPATTEEQRHQYADIARTYDEAVDQPSLVSLNKALKTLGVGPVSVPLFHSVVELADAYLQLSVPRFEFPRQMPPTVHFVGTPPIIPGQAPLPPWAHELDGSRKVVLVTQGTVANHNFELLIAPTLAALANEPDVLVVATTGGRPVDAIPCAVPSNARVASFLPFEWLLPRVDVLRHQWRLWQRQPGHELWNSAGHRRDDRGQGRRQRTSGVVRRRSQSRNQRADTRSASRRRPHRARSTRLPHARVANG
jgi:UDP:flavonoid glycosyltransferase YjiC (YdhE family)